MRIHSLSFVVLLSACSPAGETSTHCHPESAHTHAHADVGIPPEHGGVVIPHAGLPKFENNGNSLMGIATTSLGAGAFEVWRSEVAPGGRTPLHVHETEEVFVVLRGKGKMIVGEKVLEFEAPATVIAPAGIPHQLENTGDVPTEQIVIVGIGSRIEDDGGKLLELPWRK